MSFKQFLLEDIQVSRIVINPNTKKDYKSTTYHPLSSSEQQRALAILKTLPRATPDRAWFDTDNEIDLRTIGFIWSKNSPVNVIIGSGRACGLGLVPANAIIATQSSVKVEGLEAYIANKKLLTPVVLEYREHPVYSVLVGHTRIAAQMLAGRSKIEALVVLEQDLIRNRRQRANYTE